MLLGGGDEHGQRRDRGDPEPVVEADHRPAGRPDPATAADAHERLADVGDQPVDQRVAGIDAVGCDLLPDEPGDRVKGGRRVVEREPGKCRGVVQAGQFVLDVLAPGEGLPIGVVAGVSWPDADHSNHLPAAFSLAVLGWLGPGWFGLVGAWSNLGKLARMAEPYTKTDEHVL